MRKKYLISDLKDKEPAMKRVMQQKYNLLVATLYKVKQVKLI